ncbi:hypothetical protein V1525DRAFT_107773 [Lipomyces kononenkoae]|uniref:Uncharacterized protein n=1 Tax=Lipomyces kononenkoae TaxID=34357 RepID=A0ACC3SRB9_LIPKO
MDSVYGGQDPLTGSAARCSPIITSLVIRSDEKRRANAEASAPRTAVGHESVKNLNNSGFTSNNSPTRRQSGAKSFQFTWAALPPVVGLENISSSSQHKGMHTNYNRALNLLKSNPPEQWLDLQLPRAKYLQLENAFFKLYPESLELRYPSLSYNSFTETVTVVTAPAYIHEVAAVELSVAISRYAAQYLSTYSEELACFIEHYGSTTTTDFSDAFEGSRKQPDGGVRYYSPDGDQITVVVEIGFSENYASLCRSKDMWIDGRGINVFILVCLTERPRFKNPTTVYDDIRDVDHATDEMKNSINETLRLNLSNNRHALLLYRGHKWAGEIGKLSLKSGELVAPFLLDST